MTLPTLDTLLLDSKHYSFETNTTFRGLSLSLNSGGWNVVVRAFLKDGTPVYAMTAADDPGEGLRGLLAALGAQRGTELWHHDKFYKP